MHLNAVIINVDVCEVDPGFGGRWGDSQCIIERLDCPEFRAEVGHDRRRGPQRPRIPAAVLDQLLAGADPKTVFDSNGLLDDLKKALAERVLNAEMDLHLTGEEPGTRRNITQPAVA